MATIDSSLKRCLRQLALTTPYRDISVAQLCHAASVSRASFYKHFQGKDDLLAQIIIDDLCQPVRNVRQSIPTKQYINQSHTIIDELQFNRVLEHKTFYQKMLRECPQVFLRDLTAAFVEINQTVLDEYLIDEREKEYVAFAFAADHVMWLAKWIHEGMDISPQQLAFLHHKWSVRTWESIALDLGVASSSNHGESSEY